MSIGRSLGQIKTNGLVAQLLEQTVHVRKAAGQNPAESTKNYRKNMNNIEIIQQARIEAAQRLENSIINSLRIPCEISEEVAELRELVAELEEKVNKNQEDIKRITTQRDALVFAYDALEYEQAKKFLSIRLLAGETT